MILSVLSTRDDWQLQQSQRYDHQRCKKNTTVCMDLAAGSVSYHKRAVKDNKKLLLPNETLTMLLKNADIY